MGNDSSDEEASSTKQVQQEIRSLIRNKSSVTKDDIDKLPYFKTVVRETLRLYPPTPLLVPKLTTKPSVIGGYEVEPDTIVYVNIWAIGRDPDFLKNPNEFFPERFLNCGL
ncbi:UNVERIFIED_CONTAM: cytochrome [Sesamum latifolium]|uniref:Cytochrome n=1 Tax=Sesamum latifolium TaxID=2727402 RepID=A0AAW2XTK0_9LAMI